MQHTIQYQYKQVNQMGSSSSQFIYYTLDAPKIKQLPFKLQILSEQVSKSQFTQSFKAINPLYQQILLVKAIQFPEKIDIQNLLFLEKYHQQCISLLKFSIASLFSFQQNILYLSRPFLPKTFENIRTNLKFYIYQALRAVNELHQHDLVHGNIKLENFLVTDTQEVFLVDSLISKPGTVQDELQLQFYYGYGDPNRICNDFFMSQKQNDNFELGLVIYQLCGKVLTQQVIQSNIFDFDNIDDDICIIIKKLLSRQCVPEIEVKIDYHVEQLLNLRFYLPNTRYGDINMLLSIGNTYIGLEVENEALIIIILHLLHRLNNFSDINESVEKKVLSFIEIVFSRVKCDLQLLILQVVFCLVEKLEVNQNKNYLIFFTNILSILPEINEELYYYPFIIICKFFVTNDLQQDIVQIINSKLRNNNKIDILKFIKTKNINIFESSIDQFYLVLCFTKLYKSVIKLSPKDNNLHMFLEDLMITYQYSFMGRLLLLCHDNVKDTGIANLLSTFLFNMQDFTSTSQILISRIIILVNSRQQDISSSFLLYAQESEQYKYCVDQIIQNQCMSQQFNVELLNLFIKRIQMGGVQPKMLYNFLEFLFQRLIQIFFTKLDGTFVVRYQTLIQITQVIQQLLIDDEDNSPVLINQLLSNLIIEKVMSQLKILFRQQLDLNLEQVTTEDPLIEAKLLIIQKNLLKLHIIFQIVDGKYHQCIFKQILEQQLKNHIFMEQLLIFLIINSHIIFNEISQAIQTSKIKVIDQNITQIIYIKDSRLEARLTPFKINKVSVKSLVHSFSFEEQVIEQKSMFEFLMKDYQWIFQNRSLQNYIITTFLNHNMSMNPESKFLQQFSSNEKIQQQLIQFAINFQQQIQANNVNDFYNFNTNTNLPFAETFYNFINNSSCYTVINKLLTNPINAQIFTPNLNKLNFICSQQLPVTLIKCITTEDNLIYIVEENNNFQVCQFFIPSNINQIIFNRLHYLYQTTTIKINSQSTELNQFSLNFKQLTLEQILRQYPLYEYKFDFDISNIHVTSSNIYLSSTTQTLQLFINQHSLLFQSAQNIFQKQNFLMFYSEQFPTSMILKTDQNLELQDKVQLSQYIISKLRKTTKVKQLNKIRYIKERAFGADQSIFKQGYFYSWSKQIITQDYQGLIIKQMILKEKIIYVTFIEQIIIVLDLKVQLYDYDFDLIQELLFDKQINRCFQIEQQIFITTNNQVYIIQNNKLMSTLNLHIINNIIKYNEQIILCNQFQIFSFDQFTKIVQPVVIQQVSLIKLVTIYQKYLVIIYETGFIEFLK
ncbi:Kinase [Spironucleus salmonicida]|uniref:Kinase n=1 Tax=Spironucleus salmonicida TaxID=348837 RepID=V6LAI8_9EUKA|nr:Kinase [Spironucleus salmonicida]|eukprot:EST41427.1 Kinase [Spironucleus salmonicida]